MSPTKRIVFDTNTMQATVHGIKHDTLRLMDQTVESVVYDPDQGVFRFREDAFDHRWLARNKVQLIVMQ